jgi:hypothetical protein
VEKNQSNENLKTTAPVLIVADKKSGECGIIKYVGSLISNDARYTREIKS